MLIIYQLLSNTDDVRNPSNEALQRALGEKERAETEGKKLLEANQKIEKVIDAVDSAVDDDLLSEICNRRSHSLRRSW